MRFAILRQLGWERPSMLLAGVEPSEPAFYASSWLLVHYLMNVHGDAFAEFQSSLARGLSDAEAWARTFPGLADEALDRAVQAYVQEGQYEHYTFRVTLPQVQTSASRLSHADGLALRALLRKTCFKCPTRVRNGWREDVQLALAGDPHNVRATALLIHAGGQSEARALALARDMVREHPDDWLAWVSLGVAAMNAGTYAELAAQPDSDPARMRQGWLPSRLRGSSWPRSRTRCAASASKRYSVPLPRSACNRRTASCSPSAVLLAQLGPCAPLRELAARLAEISHSGLDATEQQWVRTQSESCRDAAPSPPAAAQP